MLSYHDAVSRMLDHIHELPPVSQPIDQAVGHSAAAPHYCPIDLPPFRNSSMDGFTLIAADTAQASSEKPVALRLTGESAAGAPDAPGALNTGTAMAIMTGGRLPDAADAILPVEDGTVENDFLIVSKPVQANTFVRAVGADWSRGSTLLHTGDLVTPELLPALCAAGLTHVTVRQKPRIGWISTGAELIDDLSTVLGPTQIFNATGFFGDAVVAQSGGLMVDRVTTDDNVETFKNHINRHRDLGCDLILSTGAVSVGSYDFVRTAVEQMGATVHVHRAKVRPGKPVLFATFPCGTPFLGLPGNPVSTAMGFRMFAIPILRRMLGQALETPFQARLKAEAQTPKGLTVFMRAHMSFDDGAVWIEPTPHQESFKTRSLVGANAWLIHPEGTETLKAGELINALPLWPDSLRLLTHLA